MFCCFVESNNGKTTGYHYNVQLLVKPLTFRKQGRLLSVDMVPLSRFAIRKTCRSLHRTNHARFSGRFATLEWAISSRQYPTVQRNDSNHFIERSTSSGVPDGISQTTNDQYLHVGPSGDCWTGHSIFAAKHLQPDYVKSVKLPVGTNVEILLDILEDSDLARKIYDSGIVPSEILEKAKE